MERTAIEGRIKNPGTPSLSSLNSIIIVVPPSLVPSYEFPVVTPLVKPVVEVKTDLNITIDGENIDGIQGEWIIIQEEEKKDGKNTVVIRIERKEI